MHDEVDALDDGGWWEGQVTQLGKQRYKVQPFISNTLLTVKRADVRTGVVWNGRDWSLRQTAGQFSRHVCCFKPWGACLPTPVCPSSDD